MSEDLDQRIQRVGTVAEEAFKELYTLQKGVKRLVKTGSEIIDGNIGGLLPGDIVLICGAPSSGKSHLLYKMIDSMMSPELNRDALNYVSCEWSMEMKMLNKLLRSAHDITGKKKSEILFNKFNEDEAEKVKDYYKSLQDDRRFVVQSPVTPKEFYSMAREFCILHKDKDAILLSADHLLLFSGGDKQAVLEQISESINLLKLEFNNVYFLLLSQLNRQHNSIIKAKSNEMIPTNSLIFGSSFMEQLASYIIIITNPYKQAIDEYLKVSSARYDYLSEYFGEEDNNGRISFSTIGKLFMFLTKTRESDNPWKDLFVVDMGLSGEQLSKMKHISSNTPTAISSPFQTPTFEKLPPVTPNFNMENAFGDKPF